MKLYDSGVYLVNGTELVADDAQAAAAIKSRTGREVAKAEAAQAVLLAKENAQKSAGVLFEKTMSENRQELKSACEKADFDCEILSQTADKNRSRVIDEAIKILAL